MTFQRELPLQVIGGRSNRNGGRGNRGSVQQDGHVFVVRRFLVVRRRAAARRPVDGHQKFGDEREQKRFAEGDGDRVQDREHHHHGRHDAAADQHVRRGVFDLFLLRPLPSS